MRSRRNPTALRRRLVALIAVVAMADFAFGAVNIVHMTDAGLAPSSVGTVLAIAGFVSTMVEAPSGALGDMYGQRRILIIGLVSWGGGQMLFGLTSSPWPIAVALVLWAIGIACYSGAPFALVVNALRAEGREDLVSRTVRQAQVVRWGASAVGALTIFLVGDWLEPGLVVAGAGFLLALLAVWVRLTWEESATARGEESGVLGTLREGVRLCRRGEIRAIVCFTVLESLGFAVVVLAWQPIAQQAGLGTSALGLVLIVFTAAAALGAACSRIGERKPAAWLLIALAVLASLLMSAWWGARPVLGALLVAEAVIGFTMAVLGVWSHAVFPDHLRNTMVSIVGVVGGMTVALADGMFGALWSAIGVTEATAVAGAALLAMTTVMGFLRPWRVPRAPKGSSVAGGSSLMDGSASVDGVSLAEGFKLVDGSTDASQSGSDARGQAPGSDAQGQAPGAGREGRGPGRE